MNEPRCDVCNLYKSCKSPKMRPTGSGKANVLVVAEAPGKSEDEKGIQLIGESGTLLRNCLNRIGIDLDEDCIKTNAIICRPPDNRTPTQKELDCCRPNLVKTIEKYNPIVILTLGDKALRQVLSPYWRKDFGQLQRWVGFQIPLQPLNTWICPTYHPAYILRDAQNQVLYNTFVGHLRNAFSLKKRPWKNVPDYCSLINITDNVKDIEDRINDIINNNKTIAIDYETNMLKPDSEAATCISAAVAWGVHNKLEGCIAYLITPETKELTRKLLLSKVPKIAANIKFETRWSKKFFGASVKNWHWDTMLAAHVLDNRENITSLDFQALVMLGFPDYSSGIEAHFKSFNSNTPSCLLYRIDSSELLKYNALDSILEFELATKQKQMMQYLD
ncbi:MAG: uracil-DNA glycosylase family protein [Halobacteria archaeon]